VRPFTLTGLRECIQSHGFEVREAVRFRHFPLLWDRPYLSPLRTRQLAAKRLQTLQVVRFSKDGAARGADRVS